MASRLLSSEFHAYSQGIMRTGDESKRESEIGARLKAFRAHLKISQATFAREIGISNKRLQSYETGRVPLRYWVFSLVSARFSINPFWLSTGLGGMTMNPPFDDSPFVEKVPKIARFSEVFDQMGRQLAGTESLYAGRERARLIEAKKNVDAVPKEKLSPEVQRKLAAVRALLTELCELVQADAEKYQAQREAFARTQSFWVLPDSKKSDA